MALVQYYNQSLGSNTIDTKDSPYTRRHTFGLRISSNLVDEEHAAFDAFSFSDDKVRGLRQIQGIVEELPQINYSTTIGDSPVANISEKVKKFSNNKYIKMFGMQNSNYRPPVITDGWTQQFPKEASPLTVNIKFRAYPFVSNYYNTTNYNDIIRFLIFATTPKSYTLKNSMEYFGSALDQAEKKGEELKERFENFYDALQNSNNNLNSVKADLDAYMHKKLNENNQNNESIQYEPKTVNELTTAIGDILEYFENLGNMSDVDVGGCPILAFNIEGFIRNSLTPWLIKSWSFKPAINVTDNNNPIYVDFNLGLTTQQVLTNAEINSLIMV